MCYLTAASEVLLTQTQSVEDILIRSDGNIQPHFSIRLKGFRISGSEMEAGFESIRVKGR